MMMSCVDMVSSEIGRLVLQLHALNIKMILYFVIHIELAQGVKCPNARLSNVNDVSELLNGFEPKLPFPIRSAY